MLVCHCVMRHSHKIITACLDNMGILVCRLCCQHLHDVDIQQLIALFLNYFYHFSHISK